MKRLGTLVTIGAFLFGPLPAAAQHDMARMGSDSPLPLGVPWTRFGSGTSWLPDASPMHALHGALGAWTVMLHGAAFGQFNRQDTFRGDTQLNLVDWEMLMAARPLAGGVLRANVMTSLQPLFVGPRGYSELLQTGGSDAGTRLVNRQHPHDLVGELALLYDRSLTSAVAASVYVAPAGEPAIGPVSYMHRRSAWDDPFAPIGHHWQDATHDAHGVVTAGVYSQRIKLEGSVFNAREPDSDRFNLDYRGARLDSYSGRVSLAPNPRVTLSAWAGYLYAHDPLEEPMGMQRHGVSLLNVERNADGRTRSTGVVWGLNVHHHGALHEGHADDPGAKTYNLSSALLAETSWEITKRTTMYGRVEEVDKSADELGVAASDLTQMYTVRALSLGASYDLVALRDAWIAVGARGTLNLLPDELRVTYGTTRPVGFAIYLRVRPARSM